MSYHSYIQTQPLSPYSMDYFQQLNNQVNQINFQIKHINHFQQQRQKKFLKSIQQYKKYLQKQRKALQKNNDHCRLRNQWYQDQIKKSWQISISNRPLILRSLARTNILKRQADQWLSRIDDNVLAGYINDSYTGQQKSSYNPKNQNQQSLAPQNDLKGSKLIQKYNQILSQYYHKI